MAQLNSRLSKLENSENKSQKGQKIKIISRSAYESMTIIQKLNLPPDVHPELTDAEKEYHQNILDGNHTSEPHPTDGNFTDEQVREAIEENGGLFYDFDESELDKITVKTKPVEQSFIYLTPKQKRNELRILYGHLIPE